MKRFFWNQLIFIIHVFVMSVISGVSAAAQIATREEQVNSLAGAERSFSKTSVAKGIRESFLEYFAEDALVFRPNPVNGKKFYRERKNIRGTLSWDPVFADVSFAGDLGYTTGPYQFRENNNSPASYGHFVSIWKKQNDGSWKVAIDIGIQHDSIDSNGKNFFSPSLRLSVDTFVDQESEQSELLGTDRAFSALTEKSGIVHSMTSFASSTIRLYREGATPFVGMNAAVKALFQMKSVLSWEPAVSVVAKSGDLGYTYGTMIRKYGEPTKETVEQNHYLRIWRKDKQRKWKVVLDIALPVPDKK